MIRSTNEVVRNALAAKACNTSQLELSLHYAGRLQSELRDVARSGNGYAHVPKDEVWINSRVRNSAAAANAGDKKCKVTLETVTFNQGVKPETRHMSIPELRTLLKMLGKGSDAESFIQRLETSGSTDIAINDVDLYAAII